LRRQFGHLDCDDLKNARDVVSDIRIPKTEDGYTLPREPRIALSFALCDRRMLPSIQLDG
jgi:hypothetical protein